MRTRIAFGWWSLAAAVVATSVSSLAQDSKCPGTLFGGVCFPQGVISFADEVVSYVPGRAPAVAVASEPKSTLGVPDAGSGPTFLSLGCNGVLTVRFIDNALIDVKGPDLYVFEIGPAVEATEVAISTDNRQWIDLGRIEGSTRAVDISAFVSSGQAFQYVRLTNLSTDCGGASPGADIDAVAAIGSARRIGLDAAVLFDTGRATLKANAQRALDPVLMAISAAGPNVRVSVEGHTDDVGSLESNQKLSEGRARAVSWYLSRRSALRAAISVTGYGESRPRVPNDSPLNRSQNRRVDVLIASD
jgi:OmpA-OmpF porin, OOP family